MYIYLLSKYHTVIATATHAFLAADPGIFYWEGVQTSVQKGLLNFLVATYIHIHTYIAKMFYPYLTYCNIVWASTYPTRLEGISKIQRKIVKIATISEIYTVNKAYIPFFEFTNHIRVKLLSTGIIHAFLL